ncbi:MAG: cytochrome c peroxidase [Myxococcota bacterium]
MGSLGAVAARRWGLAWLALAAVCACEGQAWDAALEVELSAELRARIIAAGLNTDGPVRPPASPTNALADDAEAAALGEALFFDVRLSPSGTVACATCHMPERGFTDGRELARGVALSSRNTPTVLNTAWNRWFFWDGRADSLWAQALGPIENQVEMAGSRLELAHLVFADATLRGAYEALFGGLPELGDSQRFPGRARPVADDPGHPDALAWAAMAPADRDAINGVFANLGKALEAYERTLISRDSDFDRFARALATRDAEGLRALDGEAQRGMKRFFGDAGCTLCHGGPNFTDREFHNIGLGPEPGSPPDRGRYDGVALVERDPFNGLGAFSDAPLGDHNDKLVFLALTTNNLGEMKTPGLRDVALTGPYMHDGRFDTLEAALGFYQRLDEVPAFGHREESLQPLEAGDAAVAEMAAFLRALSGRGDGGRGRGRGLTR